MGGAEIGLSLVRVEVFGRSCRARIAVLHQGGPRPVDEVLGGRPRRGASTALHVTGVEQVELLHLGPEHHAVRVEMVHQLSGHYDIVAHLSPMNAVRRNVAGQSALIQGVCLVPLGLGYSGATVDKRVERPAPDDGVVLGRSFHLHESQAGLRPVDSVGALRIARVGHVAPVVHAVDVAVLDDGGVEGTRPNRLTFARLVVLDGDPSRLRLLELEPRAVETFDQEVVHEQLPPRTDISDCSDQFLLRDL